MNNHYDIAVIGAGISALLCVYTLNKNNPNTKIIILEKGNSIENRKCPVSSKQKCLNCKTCAIMNGEAGAGAFSDGKFILGVSYGGWLQDSIGYEETEKYINKVNDILVEFGDTSEIYNPSDRLKLLCLQHDILMQQSKLKHIGTDNNLKIMSNLINYLKNQDNITILSNTTVNDIIEYCGDIIVNTDKFDIYSNKAIIAVGRSGSKFLSNYCKKNNIKVKNNQVDIGVRVELDRNIWKEFEEEIYEPKLIYKTEKYKDVCRMFCFNGGGIVVNENTDGIITVNGHAYSENSLKTKNSNFAILNTINFTEPFNDPVEYINHISKLANMIGGGSIVQRFGDLINGQRTTQSRLEKSTIIPTLNCTAGDLSLVLPKRQLDNIVETIYKLNEIAKGTSNYDTLLYGIECKQYSVKPESNEYFEIKDNIYCIGDCSGNTRSLSQAGAHGIYVGEKII